MLASSLPATHHSDLRLQALLQLTAEGVEEAAADLWHEYGIDVTPTPSPEGLRQDQFAIAV